MRKQKQYGVPHGVALWLGMQGLSFGTTWLVKRARQQQAPNSREENIKQDQRYYRTLKQPVFAPPGWVFGPVWFLNTILEVAGIIHVANQKPGAYRSRYLAVKSASVAIYSTFNAFNFGLKTTLGSAVLTVTDLFVNATSLGLALKNKDQRAAWSHLPLIPWLSLASVLAICIAAWNRDPFFEVPAAVADPNPKYLKPAPTSSHEKASV